MKQKRLFALLCLVALVFSLAGTALADVLIEPYWFDVYDVDYDIYVVTSDGKPLAPRDGPGVEYYAYDDDTIPHNTWVHASMECPAESGEKWCYVEPTDPDMDFWGWIPVSNTSAAPAPASGTGRAGTSASTRNALIWALIAISILCFAVAAVVVIVVLKKNRGVRPAVQPAQTFTGQDR